MWLFVDIFFSQFSDYNFLLNFNLEKLLYVYELCVCITTSPDKNSSKK